MPEGSRLTSPSKLADKQIDIDRYSNVCGTAGSCSMSTRDRWLKLDNWDISGVVELMRSDVLSVLRRWRRRRVSERGF